MPAYCSQLVMGSIIIIQTEGNKIVNSFAAEGNKIVNGFAEVGMQCTLPSFLIPLVAVQALTQRWAGAVPRLKQVAIELT